MACPCARVGPLKGNSFNRIRRLFSFNQEHDFRSYLVLKLARYNKAIARFHRALVIAKEEFILFGFTTGILLFLSAVGIYHFENEAQPEVFASMFHSLWWAIATLTTVG
ncbi:ion transporter, partial [Roseiconus lacunae]|uniref:ion transporter n=1 Tax=Roseiconus lacunae TaxID=2605694 RepID=UPI0036F3B794|nr:hypothetical protein [Roseiconus lacunae]